MIIQFSVSNFRCFRGLQTLNLTASGDNSLSENCIDITLPGLSGKRWLKGAGIYGANASGKSTVLDALAALAHLVTHSAKVTDPNDPIEEIEPFALCPDQSTPPTAFGIVFVSESIRYEYRVAARQDRIWHESLRAFPSAREQTWYSRDWDPESETYVWTPERPAGFRRDTQLEGYTLRNVLFLSKAVANSRAELGPVFHWFKERLHFIDLSASNNMSFGYTLKQLHDQTDYAGRISDILRHADIGVTGANIIEKNLNAKEIEEMLEGVPPNVREQLIKKTILRPELLHNGSVSGPVPLPWESESGGTHRIFALAGPWLDILNKGFVVCIDELETSMHPMMVRELLRMFFSAKENSKGAQIVFTTHNPLLLDTTFVRRDQIWFTDKDDKGASHLYPLTDYSPRKGESLVRGYLSGRYGAVPFIPTGLLDHLSTAEIAGTTTRGTHE